MGKNATGRDLRDEKSSRLWTMPAGRFILESRFVRFNLNGGKTIGPYKLEERLLKGSVKKKA
jgi:hypothetical protein